MSAPQTRSMFGALLLGTFLFTNHAPAADRSASNVPTLATGAGTARILQELDLRASAAASARPRLRLPARIGVARIEDGTFTAIPPAEWRVWAGLRSSVDPAIAEVSPVTTLVAQSLTPDAISATPHIALSNIRLAGAREHIDVILVYEVSLSRQMEDTEVTLLDATIVGAWLFPTHRSHLVVTTSAALIDVSSGYVYGSAVGSAEDGCNTTLLGSGERLHKQRDRVVRKAVDRLTPELAALIQRLGTTRVDTPLQTQTAHETTETPRSQAPTAASPAPLRGPAVDRAPDTGVDFWRR